LTCASGAFLLLCLPKLSGVQYVAILVGMLSVLCLLRGFLLPRELTPEGVEEVVTNRVVGTQAEYRATEDDRERLLVLSRGQSSTKIITTRQ